MPLSPIFSRLSTASGQSIRFTGQKPRSNPQERDGFRLPEPNTTLPDGIQPPDMSEPGILRFLSALDARMEGVWTQLCQARWSNSLVGVPENSDALVKAQTAYARHWYNTPVRTWLDSIGRSLLPRIISHNAAGTFQWDFYNANYHHEPVTTAHSLPDKVKAIKDDTELSERVVALYRQFENERGSKGRAAWFKPAHEARSLGQHFLTLLNQRNAQAGQSCHQTYYDHQMYHQHDLDPYHWRRLRAALVPEAQRALRKLDKVTQHPGYIRAKAQWDEDLLFALGKLPVEELIRRTAVLMGVNQDGVSRMVRASSLFKGALHHKTSAWFCEAVNPPFDVRAMMNVPIKPEQRTLFDYEGILHEVAGHGFDYLSLNPKLPFSARTHHDGASVETLAIHFETLLYDLEWLEAVAGMPAEYIERRRGMLEMERRNHLLKTVLEAARSDVIEEALYTHANKKEPVMERHIHEALLANGFPSRLGRGGKWLNGQRFIMEYVAYNPNYAIAAFNAMFLNDYAKQHFAGMSNPLWGFHLARSRKDGKLRSWEEQWGDITQQPVFTDRDVPRVLAKLTQAV